MRMSRHPIPLALTTGAMACAALYGAEYFLYQRRVSYPERRGLFPELTVFKLLKAVRRGMTLRKDSALKTCPTESNDGRGSRLLINKYRNCTVEVQRSWVDSRDVGAVTGIRELLFSGRSWCIDTSRTISESTRDSDS